MTCLCTQDKCCAILCEVRRIVADADNINRVVLLPNDELVIYQALGKSGKGVLTIKNYSFPVDVVITKTTGASPVTITMNPNDISTFDFTNTTEIKLVNTSGSDTVALDYQLCVIKN